MSSAAETLGIPVISGNVSLYNETDGRGIPPTPVVGCVGIVADVRRMPNGWNSGDVVLLAEAAGDEAGLIQFVWRAAPHLSLAHDVSDGGLAHAVREAEQWSGREARVNETEAPHGSVVLACDAGAVERLDWHHLGVIGVIP